MAMSSYTRHRQNWKYMQEVRSWLDELDGEVIIDVGSHDTDIVTHGRFSRRIAVDPARVPLIDGVEVHRMPWQKYQPPDGVDVITCLQVLEHLPDKELYPFTDKLLRTAPRVIVSVPYKWPKHKCSEHCQDPIDWPKLVKMMHGANHIRSGIVAEKPAFGIRVLAMFEGWGQD